VRNYLVEAYRANVQTEGLSEMGSRMRAAAEELTRAGMPVRFLGSISVPDDEMCFHLYEAASASLVAEACRRASIAYERVVEGVCFSSEARWG
jgi:hypothetical protein